MPLSDRLLKLDDKKLMDVVKNYRQYGYSEELRNNAISILKDRGISEEHLKLTGNYDNKNYDRALELFNAFKINSKIAAVLYILIFIALLAKTQIGFNYLLYTFSLTVRIAYLAFLIRTFQNQSKFYKSKDDDFGTEGALTYLILGMPFYCFMYFYFRNQMKEKLSQIQ
jgi:hypothetical protein